MNLYFNGKLSIFLAEVRFDTSEENQLSYFQNSRFRPVKHLKMTIWTSVLWKMTIHMSTKWLEVVIESDMCSQFYIETVYRLIHSHNINTVSFFAIRILCLWYDVKNVIWPPNSEGFLIELWWNFYGINLQSMQWWLIADESIWPVSNVHGKTSFIVSTVELQMFACV